MSVSRPGPASLPPLTDDMVASYLHGRGDAPMPDGLLAAARAHVLRPVRTPWPGLAFGLTMTLAAVLIAVAVLVIPSRPAPTTPVADPVRPARELVLAIYRSTMTGNDVWLSPADPVTTLPLEDVDPVHIFEPFETHLSPDGRTLAALTQTVLLENGSGEPTLHPDSGAIRLIDVESWTVREAPVTKLGIARNMTWTPDSKALVWFTPTQTDPDQRGRAYRLMRWTVGSPTPEVVLDLPDTAFVPADTRIVLDREGLEHPTLAVYGATHDGSEDAQNTPRVLSIDLEAQRVLGGVDLPDPPLDSTATRPAVVWDLPRERLFVATRNGLVTIGLPGLDIAAHALSPDITASTPVGPGALMSGALSPDGERLYLTGLEQAPFGDDGTIHFAPLGLRVIDTHDGSLITAGDSTIGQLTMSPTGDRLLVAGYPEAGTYFARSPGDVRMLDTDTLEVLASVGANVGTVSPGPVVMAVSWDGRFGYLQTYVPSEERYRRELTVVDLADGRTITQRDPDDNEDGPAIAVIPLGGACGRSYDC